MKNFERESNTKDVLQIGLIKLTKDWLADHDISYTKIERHEEDGNTIFYIEVDGDVILHDFHINYVGKIPEYIRFRNVSGRFVLGNNNF